MKLNELMEGQVPAPAGDADISGLTSKASEVAPGFAFFAIKGTKADGHQFIPEAVTRGAAAIIAQDPKVLAEFPKAIIVPSTRRALAAAAARWFGEPSRALELIGVTGTNGKTTTTFLLQQVWEQLGAKPGVIGTVEYRLGEIRRESQLTTPDALSLQAIFREMVDHGVAQAAMEVSSIALDQDRPWATHFDVGIFTNLSLDHLDYHGDMESYYLAKRRFFTDYGLLSAAVNVDDPFGARLLKEAGEKLERIASFSLSNPEADFWVSEVSLTKDGTSARLHAPEGEHLLRSPLIGRHNLYNGLGVVAALWLLGLETGEVVEALCHASGAPGRLEPVALKSGEPKVFVDYAHSPDALEKVLVSLRDLKRPSSRIITVFGCGGDRDRGKRPKMGELVSKLSEVTIATSDNPRTEDPDAIIDEIENGVDRSGTEYRREVNRKAAIHMALSMAGPEDLVLVAGKGHETYQILGTEKVPFDDREVVREFFGA